MDHLRVCIAAPKSDMDIRELLAGLDRHDIKLLKDRYAFLTILRLLWAKMRGYRLLYFECRFPESSSFFEKKIYRLVDTLLVGTDFLRGEYARHCNIPFSTIITLPRWTTSGPTQMPDGRSSTGTSVLVAHQSPAPEELQNLVVDPSVEFAELDDGFPQALLDAMAHGMLPIVERFGGADEIVSPGMRKFLFPSGDIKECSRLMTDVLSMDPEQRARLVAEMQEWVKQFDTVNVSARLRRVIEHDLDHIAGEDQLIA